MGLAIERPLAERAEGSVPLGDLRFRRLVGEAAWDGLPLATRLRFGRRVADGDSLVFRGRIDETRMTALGRLLAHTARLFGAPLPLPDVRDGAAAVVTVTEAPEGQYWTRQYGRYARFPQIVHSAKAFGGPTGIREVVGGPLRILMGLRLRAEDDLLLFESVTYEVGIGALRIPLPRFLAPRLTVAHRDLGRGRFVFTLQVGHPLTGTLIEQAATFHDTGDTA